MWLVKWHKGETFYTRPFFCPTVQMNGGIYRMSKTSIIITETIENLCLDHLENQKNPDKANAIYKKI